MTIGRRKRTADEKKPMDAGFRVLLVQCTVCAVLVLILWLFAMVGGNAADQLRAYFSARFEETISLSSVSAWVEQHTAFGSTAKMHLSVASQPTLPIAATDGRITSTFGNRENPTSGGDEFHKGLDIAAVGGTPIAAMRFGVVTKVEEDQWFGNYVVLAHGDAEVTYAHCSDVLVKVGDVVKAGDTVATVGNSGNSTGYHVHVQLWCNGQWRDPAEWIAVSAYD